ncbi:MAG: hypothetical protein AAGD13_00710 [Pseudomonadota bacterium]
MTTAPLTPAELAEVRRLSSDEAIAWLAERGVHTSRTTLDNMHRAGKLRRYIQAGRVRIVYLPDDLIAAFFKGIDQPCPSISSAGQAGRHGTSEAPSPGARYARAQELLGKPTPS